MLTTPFRPSKMESILAWNMSWELLSPNGNLRQQYRPNGVLKVVSSCDDSSSFTAQ